MVTTNGVKSKESEKRGTKTGGVWQRPVPQITKAPVDDPSPKPTHL